MWQQKNHANTDEELRLMFRSVMRLGVRTRWAGLCFSETADLLEISHTTVSRVYTAWCEKADQSGRSPLTSLISSVCFTHRMIIVFRTIFNKTPLVLTTTAKITL